MILGPWVNPAQGLFPRLKILLVFSILQFSMDTIWSAQLTAGMSEGSSSLSDSDEAGSPDSVRRGSGHAKLVTCLSRDER